MGPVSPEQSDEGSTGNEPDNDDLRGRLAALEQRATQLDVQLLEQEHRTFATWRNWWVHRHRPEGLSEHDEKPWVARRNATRWALLWRLVTPGTVTAGGVSAAAVAGLYFAFKANQLLGNQNVLIERQNGFFQQQIEKQQEQIQAQAQEAYLGRRAALVGTLYDRTDCATPIGSDDPGPAKVAAEPQCPLVASRRAREDALRSYIQIERQRSPLLILSREGAAQPVLDLAGVELSEGHLEGVDLLYANLEGANLGGADLSWANLGGADLEGASLELADLEGASLELADLELADLELADLGGAYLRGAYLRGAYLGGAYLQGADLGEANLQGADLEGASLQGADLSNADLRGADLNGADLSEANLDGANLRGAVGLTQPQLDAATCWDSDTKLPDGLAFKGEPHCPDS